MLLPDKRVLLIECKSVKLFLLHIHPYYSYSYYMFGEGLCVHIQRSDRRRLQCGRAELTARALFSSLCSIRHTHTQRQTHKHTSIPQAPRGLFVCQMSPDCTVTPETAQQSGVHTHTHTHTHTQSSPLSCPSCYTQTHISRRPMRICFIVVTGQMGTSVK